MDGLEAMLYERWSLSTDWIAQVDRSLVFDFCAAWYRDLSAKQLSGTIPDGILSNQLIQLYVESMMAWLCVVWVSMLVPDHLHASFTQTR